MNIRCVTPCPALDVTYTVPELRPHTTHRVSSASIRPGGKGVNVARLIAEHGPAGTGVSVHGFLGGPDGRRLRDLLRQVTPGIRQEWTAAAANTRTTVAVVDLEDTTMFNEPAGPITDEEWDELIRATSEGLGVGDWVTVSGSLPPSGEGRLGELVRALRADGARNLVDTSGPALLEAVRAGADVVKPNEEELLAATGTESVEAGLARLREAGPALAVVSLGERGVLAADGDRRRLIASSRRLTGNPTGAGDALVAGLVSALHAGGEAAASGPAEALEAGLERAMRQGVAWSAAAVLSPVAGEIEEQVVGKLTDGITVKELS